MGKKRKNQNQKEKRAKKRREKEQWEATPILEKNWNSFIQIGR